MIAAIPGRLTRLYVLDARGHAWPQRRQIEGGARSLVRLASGAAGSVQRTRSKLSRS
jgi:hypothetical protein